MKKKLLSECVRRSKQLLPNHRHQNNYKHFSFLVQNNKIISYGFNLNGERFNGFGYPEYSKKHSEQTVYFKGKGLLKRNISFEIVNVRLNKNSKIKISRPCKCCISFLKFLGCSTVWFTTELGFAKLIL
jgi:hypothetical protein